MADLRGLPGSSTEKWRWQRHGACRGANPELFFHPDGKRGPGHRRREQAAAASSSWAQVAHQPTRAGREHHRQRRRALGVSGPAPVSRRTALRASAWAGRPSVWGS
jgi:WhiB family transcriptional regulator, redox-sensing transcriptional regulator